MPRIPLVFGGGLDREVGMMAMQRGGMEDLRNVHILQGKFQVRRGFERVLTFTDDSGNEQTDVLGGIAMLGRRAAVYVTYDSVNYKVNVFVGDNTGAWAAYLGEWPFLKEDGSNILSATNADAPVILLAEYNGKVFLAHTYSNVGWRAQTYFVYYDTGTSAYKLEALKGTWSGVDHKIRFRGVLRHPTDYVIGLR